MSPEKVFTIIMIHKVVKRHILNINCLNYKMNFVWHAYKTRKWLVFKTSLSTGVFYFFIYTYVYIYIYIYTPLNELWCMYKNIVYIKNLRLIWLVLNYSLPHIYGMTTILYIMVWNVNVLKHFATFYCSYAWLVLLHLEL